MSDQDGYPTNAELASIREWKDLNDAAGWLRHCAELFVQPYGSFAEPTPGIWRVATGGWSGNEDIIAAMREAHSGVLWMLTWKLSASGGLFVFQWAGPGRVVRDRALHVFLAEEFGRRIPDGGA